MVIKMDTKIVNITERPDSVTIKETAKGDLYFEVKVRGDVLEDSEGLVQRAKATYCKLAFEMRGLVKQ